MRVHRRVLRSICGRFEALGEAAQLTPSSIDTRKVHYGSPHPIPFFLRVSLTRQNPPIKPRQKNTNPLPNRSNDIVSVEIAAYLPFQPRISNFRNYVEGGACPRRMESTGVETLALPYFGQNSFFLSPPPPRNNPTSGKLGATRVENFRAFE